MPYNAKDDKTLKTIKSKGQSLFFAEIKSYNGGAPKVQLRRQYLTKNDELKDCSAGRLTLDDIKWLKKKLPKILQAVEKATGEAPEETGKE